MRALDADDLAPYLWTDFRNVIWSRTLSLLTLNSGCEAILILFDHSVPALQEIERLRELNLQAEQEKVNAVAHVRSEAKEEIVKMRDKIQEVIEKLSVSGQLPTYPSPNPTLT